jgi:hypothetical protein
MLWRARKSGLLTTVFSGVVGVPCRGFRRAGSCFQRRGCETGTFVCGRHTYYGGYQGDNLRIAALFPDKRRVLHAFAGMVDTNTQPGDTAALNPTFVVDCQTFEGVPLEQYDLIVADPPYGPEHAARYGVPMPDRRKVIAACSVSRRARMRVAGSGLADLPEGQLPEGSDEFGHRFDQPSAPRRADLPARGQPMSKAIHIGGRRRPDRPGCAQSGHNLSALPSGAAYQYRQ